MIVRTYGRRSRGISRTYSESLNDDVEDPYGDPLSLSQERSQDRVCTSFALSSQDSSNHWSPFDSDPYHPNSDLPKRVSFDDSCDDVVRKSKKGRNGKKESKNFQPRIPPTSTLMEAQEFGEIMEHVDEVNFALDGLRKGQPVRIRRASLVSLLSICGTAQQRRLLRTQGMAKTIIDAILGLSIDDFFSNLAAATLLYSLTCDGQDDHLLESPGCIRFLIKLLKPIVSTANEVKAPKFCSKLLSLCKETDFLGDTTRSLDSNSAIVISKVQEILVSCKEMKTGNETDTGTGRPELCPEWLALLTVEKACLSSISLDETSGAVRRTGGNFKEKLREHGGLDAVFEVALNCHSDMEGWAKHYSSTLNAKNDIHMKSLTLLLKCLKIMENATFLSKDNQTHLLEMKAKFNPLEAQLSFTELIISIIKNLSEVYLHGSAYAVGHTSELALIADSKAKETCPINSSKKYHDMDITSFPHSFDASKLDRLISSACLEASPSISETSSTSTIDRFSLKMRANSSTSGSCIGVSRRLNCQSSLAHTSSRKTMGFTQDTPIEILDDSGEDPFAFDEDEFEPSKWDLLSGKRKISKTKKPDIPCREVEYGCQSETNVSQECSNSQSSCLPSSVVDEESSSLLADCLLSAVKVLMNLTNDNPVGCRQIAIHGGLEVMSSLIAGHFPLFSSSSSPFSQQKESTSSSELDLQSDGHLTDHELDFLVAVLGLLVNMVEKDSHNRSRLAAASVLLPASRGLEEKVHMDLIQLLCSIFLANQGGGDKAGEDRELSWNDEAALIQGEKEAEKMIVEAYAALLLAFLSSESMSIREAIAAYLPDNNLTILVPVLDRFVEFHLTLNMISPETHKAVTEVIESCRIR